MRPLIVPFAARPDIGEERWEQIVPPAWPSFLLHDQVCNANWHHLEEEFLAFQFYIIDEATDEVLGQANTIPFRWDGDPASLPDGVDGILPISIRQRADGSEPNTLCALQAIATEGNRGKGLAHLILDGMRDLGRRSGFGDLVAPVRPTLKHRYPLTPMKRYAAWTRDDGLPFDPWIRVHARLNGVILHVCPHSMTVRGTLAEWETWARMTFPETGSYIVPGALVPVEIDREQDVGLYTEPNLWMRHRLES